jgi:hypothetical protein
LAAELEAAGAVVRVVACDLADPGQVSELLASAPAAHPLRAVVHTAGVLDDAPIASLTQGQLDRVIRAKLDSAWHLHRLTPDPAHVAMVYYSSLAGWIGSAGQADYAAANAALDALAEHRRARGLPTWSVAWGLWGDASAMTEAVDQSSVARLGFPPLSAEVGLALFDRALATPVAALAATPLDRAALRRSGLADDPLWQAVAPAAGAAAPASLAATLAGLGAAERSRRLLDLVLKQTAAVVPGSSPEPDNTFVDIGMQSLGAVELRNRLNSLTGLRLPVVEVYQHPTPRALAESVLRRLALDEPAGATEPGDGGDLDAAVAVLRRHVDGLAADALEGRRLRTDLDEILSALDVRLDGGGAARQPITSLSQLIARQAAAPAPSGSAGS